jgi:phosphoglycolate phosphatase-like HAD superfamily hydrolase
VLFDIDGTLLSSGRVSGHAFEDALREVFGTIGEAERYDYSGKTDRQIVRDLMRGAGFADREIDARMDAAMERYSALLRERLKPDHVQAKPGVVALVGALAEDPRVTLGLLTGNLEPNARMKLEPIGVNPHFPFGAFGSDHEDRRRLPAVAVARALDAVGVRFAGKSVVIVGDSVYDVLCGRHLGVRAVAVATGRTTVEELRQVRADAVLPSFADKEESLAAILGEPFSRR